MCVHIALLFLRRFRDRARFSRRHESSEKTRLLERTGHGNPAARSSVSGGSSVSSATSRRSARPGKWCWSTCLRARKSRAKGGEGVRREREVFRGRGKPRRTGRTRLYAVRVALHLEDDLVPRVLQAEVQAADPGEQRDRLHGRGPARNGVTRTTKVAESPRASSLELGARRNSRLSSQNNRVFRIVIGGFLYVRSRGPPTYRRRTLDRSNESNILTPRAPRACWWAPSR